MVAAEEGQECGNAKHGALCRSRSGMHACMHQCSGWGGVNLPGDPEPVQALGPGRFNRSVLGAPGDAIAPDVYRMSQCHTVLAVLWAGPSLRNVVTG